MRSSIGEVHTLGSARAPGRTIQHLLRVPYPRAGLRVSRNVVWQRRQPKDKDVLLAVALSQERLRQRWQFVKPRRARGNGRMYRYRLHDAQGAALGQIRSPHLLEPGEAIRTTGGRSLEVVAVAPLQTEDADFAALVEAAIV